MDHCGLSRLLIKMHDHAHINWPLPFNHSAYLDVLLGICKNLCVSYSFFNSAWPCLLFSNTDEASHTCVTLTPFYNLLLTIYSPFLFSYCAPMVQVPLHKQNGNFSWPVKDCCSHSILAADQQIQPNPTKTTNMQVTEATGSQILQQITFSTIGHVPMSPCFLCWTILNLSNNKRSIHSKLGYI